MRDPWLCVPDSRRVCLFSLVVKLLSAFHERLLSSPAALWTPIVVKPSWRVYQRTVHRGAQREAPAAARAVRLGLGDPADGGAETNRTAVWAYRPAGQRGDQQLWRRQPTQRLRIGVPRFSPRGARGATPARRTASAAATRCTYSAGIPCRVGNACGPPWRGRKRTTCPFKTPRSVALSYGPDRGRRIAAVPRAMVKGPSVGLAILYHRPRLFSADSSPLMHGAVPPPPSAEGTGRRRALSGNAACCRASPALPGAGRVLSHVRRCRSGASTPARGVPLVPSVLRFRSPVSGVLRLRH